MSATRDGDKDGRGLAGGSYKSKDEDSYLLLRPKKVGKP